MLFYQPKFRCCFTSPSFYVVYEPTFLCCFTSPSFDVVLPAQVSMLFMSPRFYVVLPAQVSMLFYKPKFLCCFTNPSFYVVLPTQFSMLFTSPSLHVILPIHVSMLFYQPMFLCCLRAHIVCYFTNPCFYVVLPAHVSMLVYQPMFLCCFASPSSYVVLPAQVSMLFYQPKFLCCFTSPRFYVVSGLNNEEPLDFTLQYHDSQLHILILCESTRCSTVLLMILYNVYILLYILIVPSTMCLKCKICIASSSIPLPRFPLRKLYNSQILVLPLLDVYNCGMYRHLPLCWPYSLLSGRNKEIISLVRRTSVTSNLLVRHSHHLSNK